MALIQTIDSVALASDLVDDTSPQLGGNLDTNSFMIDFDTSHGIRDENGNEQLFFSTTSSAVNYVNVTNAATGGDPKVAALGDDSNIDLALSPKGSGEIVVGTGSAASTITSSGAYDLILDTNSGTNSGTYYNYRWCKRKYYSNTKRNRCCRNWW